MMAELVFDVGMNNGDDTAYYLASGHHVVAVEANPQLCAAAEKRFPAEVADGRLTIQNVGISGQEGDLTFWVSEPSVYSSFNKDMATRKGAVASPITVSTMRFSNLLNEYPRALYVKIDIEGSDSESIQDLVRCSSLPSFISFEWHPDAAADIKLLADLGYGKFKFIRQSDYRETTTDDMRWHNMQRKIRALVQPYPLIRKAPSLYRHTTQVAGGWQFCGESSRAVSPERPPRGVNAAEVVAGIDSRRVL